MTDAFCRFIVGDALTEMRKLPDASVDLVLTSPPFLALRSYLPADDPNKALEMGSEATPGAYIDALLTIVEEARRVLAPHGSICLELGDTFAGSSAVGGDELRGGRLNGRASRGVVRRGEPLPARDHGPGWPLDKSLSLIPESLRWAMVYGRNPFTGRETPRWRVRNVVRHFRPNPPVGALGQKWRPATSDWVVACTSGNRFFDLDSVRVPHQTAPEDRRKQMPTGRTDAALAAAHSVRTDNGLGITGAPGRGGFTNEGDPAGAPPLDWCVEDDLEWRDAAGIIEPTFPYPGAHYATFSPKLVARFIECMTPRRVCVVCGEPSRRVVESERTIRGKSVGADEPLRHPNRASNGGGEYIPGGEYGTKITTLSWTDCGHGDWRPGVVLDPFAGTFTTGAVAQGHGRSAIGVDLDPRNAELARSRIGMFLTVEGDDEPRPVTDAPASLLQGGSMEQSAGGRTGDGESSA